ncbi:bifunctional UDP-N-acetylglucosamine diphosphorylase/glucosamine-1-phosphate N-acetyltransferase GlmU [Helicobacter burdigaliensis]|uniref:bifunctional UDP-N-acetylglucosamine diphosphorylase/glucosamine-1-phosphate N-acetyltransferase GlmU n=1 Tax=Helicobacter burdigaliensis TaxID=2315334 RepID=UPI000EF6E434|nr:bifunctional UDP-N-acetylglucosamine diphosphorylase/glucosamine-1-phosphate N-acetyltransferase GlmU [Helicobacter burdigaliensis]
MSSTNLSIVILAAGAGTRMKSKTPKVLHKICGREMLYYSIKEAFKLSDDVSVVLGFEASLIQSRIQNLFEAHINFLHQDIQNYPGTGGALKNYKPKYSKILVLNGDMPLIQSHQLEGFLHKDAEIVMSVIDKPNTSGYGRVILNNGEVEKIVEEKDATKEILSLSTLNAGIYCFKSEILQKYLPKLQNNNAQKEYYLTDIISLAKSDGARILPLFVEIESFKGVNDKIDLSCAEEIMQDRIRQFWQKQGVIMRLPKTIYIEEQVTLEGECILENGVSLIGKCKITNSHIKAHSVLEESILENSDVGPMAHLRPQSELYSTHIGNFVEIKKSQLKGVKAGHLSYLGDCSIDEGTNIGAGFITCNYDGKAKHKTKIGKNVFIGSDSQAVAPISLEDDCIIGAGSTITKDVKKGELYLTRANEKRIEGFFYKFFNKIKE